MATLETPGYQYVEGGKRSWTMTLHEIFQRALAAQLQPANVLEQVLKRKFVQRKLKFSPVELRNAAKVLAGRLRRKNFNDYLIELDGGTQTVRYSQLKLSAKDLDR
jgi:hypothetical protein